MKENVNKQNVVSAKVVELIKGDKLTNEIVAYVSSNKMHYTKDDEKSAKSAADKVTDELADNKQPEHLIAAKELYNKIQDLQQQLNKQISYQVNKKFGADVYVTDCIYAINKIEGYEFFTPSYLKRLGIYHIPCGLILDTHQRCRSFVSSLLRTAKASHAKEVKDGMGVSLYIARCKEQIRFNDNLWMSTKFNQMSTLRKLHLVWGIIADCTKAEKKAVLDALGIKLSVRRRDKGDNTYQVIPIDDYVAPSRPVDVNYYHMNAVNAKPLTKEDAENVMSLPVRPLSSSKPTTGSKPTRRTTTKPGGAK